MPLIASNPALQPYLYPPSPAVAMQLQRELADRVVRTDALPETLTILGGCDVSNYLRDPAAQVYAALVTLDARTLRVIGQAHHAADAPLPYIPGLLGFREAPAIVEAMDLLSARPDVLLVDGHGISHPRGLGIASHIGVLLNLPTIGVAKSILVGSPAFEPGNRPGDWAPLVWKGQTLGAVLRTKANTQPVYVSTGNRVSLETAIRIVLSAVTKYRLPEPTRQAHLSANAFRKRHPVPGQDGA